MRDVEKLIKQTMIGSVPHVGVADVKLICDRPTNATQVDSVGNIRPVFEEVIIWLSLREDRESRVPPSPSGANIRRLPLIGRAVEPRQLPSWISLKKKYKAELTDGDGVRHGEFEFDLVAQHRSPAFSQVRGSFVKGFFSEIN